MGVGEHFFHDEVVVHLLRQFPPLLQAFRLLVVFNLQCKERREGARLAEGREQVTVHGVACSGIYE